METPQRDKWCSQLTAREKWKIASLVEQHCYCKHVFCCGRTSVWESIVNFLFKSFLFFRVIQRSIEHDINFAWRRQIGKISVSPFFEWIASVFYSVCQHFVERIIQSNDAVSMQLFAVRLLRIHNLIYLVLYCDEHPNGKPSEHLWHCGFFFPLARNPLSNFDIYLIWFSSLSVHGLSRLKVPSISHCFNMQWYTRGRNAIVSIWLYQRKAFSVSMATSCIRWREERFQERYRINLRNFHQFTKL